VASGWTANNRSSGQLAMSRVLAVIFGAIARVCPRVSAFGDTSCCQEATWDNLRGTLPEESIENL
jgi:hypothetical protein